MHIYAECDIIAKNHARRVIQVGGKTSAKSINKYMGKAYDRINLTVRKGDKDKIKAHAESMGESVNGFINRAIDETMGRDKAKPEG